MYTYNLRQRENHSLQRLHGEKDRSLDVIKDIHKKTSVQHFCVCFLFSPPICECRHVNQHSLFVFPDPPPMLECHHMNCQRDYLNNLIIVSIDVSRVWRQHVRWSDTRFRLHTHLLLMQF